MLARNMQSNKARGFFTLAEVLVTLAVLGVLAALTIPALMQNIDDQQYKTKKAYSDLSQVITRMVQDKRTLKDYESGTFYIDFKDYYEEMIGCGKSDCVPNDYPSSTYKTYAGLPAVAWYFDDGQIINAAPNFILLSVDVNGHKKGPNVWGKDVFTFQIINDVLKPIGSPGTFCSNHEIYCSKTSTNEYNGISCAHKVIMGEDY